MIKKIREWGLWRILFTFNLIASIILFFSNIFRGSISSFLFKLNPIFENDWIDVSIIPLIILFFGWRFSIKKLAEKEKIEKNLKSNKIGKILFWVGVTLLIGAYYLSDFLGSGGACSRGEGGCGLGALFLFAIITIFAVIPSMLIGTILWIKSNYGGENTWKMILIVIGSLIFQTILFCSFVYLIFGLMHISF